MTRLFSGLGRHKPRRLALPVCGEVADVTTADITMTVLDKQVEEVVFLRLSLPLHEANARPGCARVGLGYRILVDESVLARGLTSSAKDNENKPRH